MSGSRLTYVLITPARNEQELIEATIQTMIAQTHLPSKWVIVSDGSTDGTDDIINRYAKDHPWIELMRMPERRERNFGAKAICFNAAFERLKPEGFDVIGNLDADMTFAPDYMEFLVGKFAEMPDLGVAGTPVVEDGSRPDDHPFANRFADLHHVSGNCQMFRRRCLEELGGYAPIKGGGIDWVAVTTARMRGWQTQTFLDKPCFHHRKMGTASRGPVMARFKHGQEDYYLGQHPVWEILRGAFQMKSKPVVLGGLFLIFGYFWAMLKRMPRPISPELLMFRRAEQMARLRKILSLG
jgi:glycosyltransferase involved in cell wall biosynthesis